MDELIAWLGRMLDEDEAAVRKDLDAPEGALRYGDVDEWSEPLAWLMTADRVLREVAAKRVVVELHTREHHCPVVVPTTNPGRFPGNLGYVSTEYIEEGEACTTLLQLAAVYSGHPDYRPEWAPGHAQGT